MISTAAIPAFETGIRTELHHSERRSGTGIRVSVSAGANEGIDKMGVRFRSYPSSVALKQFAGCHDEGRNKKSEIAHGQISACLSDLLHHYASGVKMRFGFYGNEVNACGERADIGAARNEWKG